MGNYANRIPTPPRVPSETEQKRILDTTGQHRQGFRDHIIISMALATGLREHEIIALDVGDVVNSKGKIRRRVLLTTFKGCAQKPGPQETVFSEALRRKLKKFIAWKKTQNQSTDPNMPLFISRKGNRLSARQLRHMFRVWQSKAGIERPYNFHQLRHAACTAIYRRTKDIRLTARFARHRSLTSTERYAHASYEDLVAAVQEQPC